VMACPKWVFMRSFFICVGRFLSEKSGSEQ
jgi:hypothetical protein